MVCGVEMLSKGYPFRSLRAAVTGRRATLITGDPSLTGNGDHRYFHTSKSISNRGTQLSNRQKSPGILSFTYLTEFHSLKVQKRKSVMNKLKAKFENAVKTTAMSAQQIYKHKSFNLSKTQEDPEYALHHSSGAYF